MIVNEGHRSRMIRPWAVSFLVLAIMQNNCKFNLKMIK